MKNITRVQTRIESNMKPSIPVSCPYCGAVTLIERHLTVPSCVHFEDFTLFRNDGKEFCEIEDPQDKADMIEATFHLSRSKCSGISVTRSGILIDSDDGMKLTIDGHFDGFLSEDEFEAILTDDDQDADIVGVSEI